jgi:serine/threonine-protein kinase
MPHEAAERVCPNTGLVLPENARTAARSVGVPIRRSAEPPPEQRSFDPQPQRRPGVGARPDRHGIAVHDGGARGDRQPHGDASNRANARAPIATTHDLQRELIGQTIGGRYKINGLLGEGGMGTVFDAEHLGLSRQVAVKVLSPSQAKKRVAVKRFQQEARAAGAIGHPNICEVYDLGLLDDGSPYLVMEKLVGQTLAERIAREGGLPFDDIVEIASQVLSGLIAAHEKGIVHRDIKPENIFLARRPGSPPIIKLLDFGVSKMMAEFQTSEDALDLTRTGMVMGTPYYMSPEQARGERNLDGRVDVYACGVVMYEALTGKRPFLAPNYNALLLAIINTSPKPIREVRPATPPELEAIVMRAMERIRADRYASAQQMLRELALPDTRGARVPAPPTADERRRAQVLGGGRVPAEPAARADDAATQVNTGSRSRASVEQATLQARRRQASSESSDDASSTLLSRRPQPDPRRPPAPQRDGKGKLPPPHFDSLGRKSDRALPPLRGATLENGDSIEIPIHIAAVADGEDIPLDEDDPTAIFSSEEHGTPRMPPTPRRADRDPTLQPFPSSAPPPKAPSPSAPPKPFRSSVPSPPKPRSPSAPPSAFPSNAPPSANPRPVSPPKAPPLPRVPPPEDWDDETIVQRPEAGPPPPARPVAPFNPEQTMKLDGRDLDDLENRRGPPRR